MKNGSQYRAVQNLKCAIFRTSCEHLVVTIVILFLCLMEKIILISKIIFFPPQTIGKKLPPTTVTPDASKTEMDSRTKGEFPYFSILSLKAVQGFPIIQMLLKNPYIILMAFLNTPKKMHTSVFH